MLSILISSTFNDMQAERDVIRSRVAPVLRRIAAQYGQSLRLIDLRWGVNTADMSEEAAAQKVLETCLNEIDRCDGYMICLLGNRYGWVPDYTRLTTLQDHGITLPHPVSVTELEIQYGILQRNKGEKSVIFLRDEVTGLPDSLWSQYNDPADDRRMERLKARLEALPEGSCEHYRLTYGEDGEFQGINSFAQRLIERTSQLLHRVFGAECQPDEAQALKRKFDSIIEEHCETYLPNPRLEQQLSDFTDSPLSVLMLQGCEGSGRSAWISRLSQSPPSGVRVIPYFCTEGTTGREILTYFAQQLNKESPPLRASQEELEEYFSELISQVEAPLWFAVDGLELMGGDEHSRLSWLPHHLPSNIRFVFTSVEHDRACNQLGESFRVQYCPMPPLPDAAGFIRASLAAAGKAVPDEILSRVAQHPLSTNYLFCDMVIRMLMLMDRHDFAAMNRGGGGIHAINAYILDKINHLPQTMEEMAFLFLYDCGEQITPGNTAHYLSAIACAPGGLRAQDLQALYPEAWDEADFSFFTAFLDGFLVCDDSGCYTFPSGLMRNACLRVGESELLKKLTVYFNTLPDNDPVKADSALPMFLTCKMVQQAGTLLLANARRKTLYIQIWNMLPHARAAVSDLLSRDDLLTLVLENGMELCEDLVRLAMLSDIFKARVPPKDGSLHRRMLLELAQLQLRCKDKRSACQTLSRLLPLQTSPLSRARTVIMLTECSFADHDGQIGEIKHLLDYGLALFPDEEILSRPDRLLLYKGLFYRALFSFQDAIGMVVHGVWSYSDYFKRQSTGSIMTYVELLMTLRPSSFPNQASYADVLRVLIGLCSLGELIRDQIVPGSQLNTEYARLLLSLLRVMNNVDSPSAPCREAQSEEESQLLREFRVLRTSLVTMSHAVALTSLHGRYDAPMLKILAHLQIHLASLSENAPERRAQLERATRILWRYFSADPLSDFAGDLADAFLSLADCCLDGKDWVSYEDTLDKWGGVVLAVNRQAIRTAIEQCRRYPDEIHKKALIRARHELNATYTEYAERLCLRNLYSLKDRIDLLLSMYRDSIRRGFHMAAPTETVNMRSALILINKLTELEQCFDVPSQSDLFRDALPKAFYTLQITTMQVILLSEQTVSEDSDDVLSQPQFFYPQAAAFTEAFISRCGQRNLDVTADTVLQLSFCLAQFKLKAALYGPGGSEEDLWEVLTLLEALTDKLPASPIPSEFLFDEVSAASVRLLQCKTWLLLGDLYNSDEDTEEAAICYRQVCQLCGSLHTGTTESQRTEASRYLQHVLPSLLGCYERLGAEEEYTELLDLIRPLLGE